MTSPTDLPYDDSNVVADTLPPGPHRTLHEMWHARCAPGRLPGRADFDPRDMPSLLPHLTIFDVERDPLRFRVRLVGTAIVEATGLDSTGRYLDELDNIEAVIRRAEAMMQSGQPYFMSTLPLTWTPLDFRTYSVLGVPLASDGRIVDKLMYTMLFA